MGLTNLGYLSIGRLENRMLRLPKNMNSNKSVEGSFL